MYVCMYVCMLHALAVVNVVTPKLHDLDVETFINDFTYIITILHNINLHDCGYISRFLYIYIMIILSLQSNHR